MKVRQGFSMATMGKEGGKKTMSYLPREGVGEGGVQAWAVSLASSMGGQDPAVAPGGGVLPLTPVADRSSQDIPAPHVRPVQPLGCAQPLLYGARQLAGGCGQEARLGPHTAPVTGGGGAEARLTPLTLLLTSPLLGA